MDWPKNARGPVALGRTVTRMDVEGEVARGVAELRARADPDRAEHEKRYLKSDFAHIGVPVPALRKTALSTVRTAPSRTDLIALAEAFWVVTDDGLPVHETRMAAIEVLARRADLLEPGDLGLAERLIRDSASWIYVDYLAEKIVGRMVLRFPALNETLDRWVTDPYMWTRRTAVLALLAGIRAGTPDLDRLTRYGDALIDEREFFIRKALGWVLRELSKQDARWVANWVGPRTDVISGITIREAVRRLPPEEAEALLAAYKKS